jgi:uncharacterized protein DUF6662
MRTPLVLAIVIASGVLIATPALADENYFGYSYGAETLPKGKYEAYLWLTGRMGKGVGTYQAWDNYNEIEYGFTDRFQGSLYINTSKHKVKDNPEFENNTSFGFEGVRTSFKYNVLSPFSHAVGLAIYVEPEYSRREKISGQEFTEFAVESKLILQKNFRDDTIVSAVNLTYEHEWEKEGDEEGAVAAEEEFEREAAVELTAGVNYRFRPKWFLGVEARRHSEYPGADLGNEEHAAYFLGPVLHYGSQRWWFTATVFPQIYGTPHVNSDRLHLEEHERIETRFKVGYNF